MSTFANASRKSSLTARRTFCAFSTYRATRFDPLTNVPTSTRRRVSAPNAAPRNADAAFANGDEERLERFFERFFERLDRGRYPKRTPSYLARFELASAGAMT